MELLATGQVLKGEKSTGGRGKKRGAGGEQLKINQAAGKEPESLLGEPSPSAISRRSPLPEGDGEGGKTQKERERCILRMGAIHIQILLDFSFQ